MKDPLHPPGSRGRVSDWTAAGSLAARRVSRTRVWSGLHAFEASYEPHALLPEHGHARPIFTYVLRGSFIEQAGQVRRDCHRGSVVFRAGGECHANVVGPRGTASLNVEIAPESWSALTMHGERDRAITGRVLSGDIEWLAFPLWREFHRDDHASALGMDEAIALLCAAVCRTIERSASDATRRLDLAAEYIGEGLGPAPGLAEVAVMVGVHPMHLAKLFRRRHGCSMGEFVRRRRIAWACGQLADESRTIASIAADAGFADHAHFTRTFRRLTGCTPGWYRERVTNAGLRRIERERLAP